MSQLFSQIGLVYFVYTADSEVHTVEAMYGILVEYSSICVETFTAADIASHGVKHYCTPVGITSNNTHIQ